MPKPGTISYDGADSPEIAATKNNVAPAAAVVPELAAKGAQYFKWETIQLTQAVLANLTSLNLTDAALFGFPTTQSKPASKCKVFPGDSNWPSPITWEVFNLLSGDALIKTVPLAAPCFSDWPEYNATLCASITSLWNDPHLQ
jgi:hypothetical protein